MFIMNFQKWTSSEIFHTACDLTPEACNKNNRRWSEAEPAERDAKKGTAPQGLNKKPRSAPSGAGDAGTAFPPVPLRSTDGYFCYAPAVLKTASISEDVYCKSNFNAIQKQFYFYTPPPQVRMPDYKNNMPVVPGHVCLEGANVQTISHHFIQGWELTRVHNVGIN